MKIRWSEKARQTYLELLPTVRKQCDRTVKRLEEARPGSPPSELKRLKQAGPAMFSVRVSREIRAILERTEGGYIICEFTRRSNRKYYSTE